MNALLLSLSDAELLARVPMLVERERGGTADVIEHLVEIDRRRLYLGQACSSLTAYCRERLGYSEDEAQKRVRVARFAARCPAVLDELRSGAIHLTGLFLISQHVMECAQADFLPEARWKSRRAIEQLIAVRFPRADVGESIRASPGTGARAELRGNESGRLEALSATGYRVEFTASAELYTKIERAKQLLSHSVPCGSLAALFGRAIDGLIREEEKRRTGAGTSRKRRPLKDGSRHVPVEIAGRVRQRDGEQCAFVDELGRRCSERRFLTLEHRVPFALGGAPTEENLCLLCQAHNQYTARQVFGERHIERKRAERTASLTEASSQKRAERAVIAGLCSLGFARKEAVRALAAVAREVGVANDEPQLLRRALQWLTPASATQ